MSEDLNFEGDDYEWLLTIVSASKRAIPELASERWLTDMRTRTVLHLLHHLLLPHFLLENLPATPVGSIRRLWMGSGSHGPIWHKKLGRHDGVPVLPGPLRTRLRARSPLPVLVLLPPA
jgi:hypothetical protein